jgi:hypothetical protein
MDPGSMTASFCGTCPRPKYIHGDRVTGILSKSKEEKKKKKREKAAQQMAMSTCVNMHAARF